MIVKADFMAIEDRSKTPHQKIHDADRSLGWSWDLSRGLEALAISLCASISRFCAAVLSALPLLNLEALSHREGSPRGETTFNPLWFIF